MAVYAEAVIEAPGPEHGTQEPPEPLVEVEDLGRDPIRGRELEVSLREDTVFRGPRPKPRVL